MKLEESSAARGALPLTASAVYVAQVPETYHFPLEIKQPLLAPETRTFKNPLPLKGPLVEVGAAPPVVVVAVPVGEGLLARLGRYLTPVAGHLDFASGAEGSKVPSCNVPRTLKKYQISLRAPLEQPR